MFVYPSHRLGPLVEGTGAINIINITTWLSCNKEKEDKVPLVYT